MSEESYTKIAKGIGMPVYLLKDAEFVLAPKDSKFYCYVLATDGVRYAFEPREALRLSCRGGKEPAKFLAWLEEQEDPI